MKRAFALLLLSGTAFAQPKKGPVAIPLPAVGADLTENPATWPKMEWMYDLPSASDAAGKVVVHWFCAPKIAACADDLARMLALRDTGKAYIVAHINGTKYDAKKYDPIHESEGIGRGTVAFGPGVAAIMKSMGVTGPASIVVGVDQKVAFVTTSAASGDLDERDNKVAALENAIKDYAVASDGPKTAAADAKFTLAMTITLSPWLKWSKTDVPRFDLTSPGDVKCDATKLSGDQIKITGQTLVAAVTCSAPKGNYELRGQLRFGYAQPAGGQGMGAEDTRWPINVTAASPAPAPATTPPATK